MGFRTRQIHAGVTPDPTTGSILTPIYQATTFVQDSVDEYLNKGYSYSRSGNPTVRALELKLADLEGGVDCACFGTGMAATQAVMLAFLNAGAHAIVSDVAYGGTYRLATKVLSRFGIEFTFADTANPDNVAAAVGRWKTPDVLQMAIPHFPAVVGVDGEHVVLPLNEQDAVGEDWRRCAPVP